MKIRVKLGDISTAIQTVSDYRAGLSAKTREFLQKLAELGVDTASVRFRTAQYDGENDVVTYPKWDGDNRVLVIAHGQAVTFIEFGSGIVYADDHPLASTKGAERGGYGQGKGSQRTWGYYGDPGSNGKVVAKGEKEVVLTHGNPASRAMYEASKEMREQIMKIAKEVFST